MRSLSRAFGALMLALGLSLILILDQVRPEACLWLGFVAACALASGVSLIQPRRARSGAERGSETSERRLGL